MNTTVKPLLIYDGQCAFCRLWIERWKTITGDSVDYATSADAAAAHPLIPTEEFRKSVVLVLPDGSYMTGARAVFTALGKSAVGRFWLLLYNRVPGFGASAESLYRSIAGYRDEMYLLTRVLWGKSVVSPGFAATRWLFLRGMAVVYGIAFTSLFTQILGLVGSKGISPAEMFLEAVHAQMGSAGVLYYPTLAWLDPGDGFLTGLCIAGMVSSGMLLLGIVPRMSALLCWLLYFSLVVAGQVFLQFQWDVLLLEAGFLTIFFAPPGLFRFLPDATEPPRAVRWLLWLLVFRLMLMSGAVKLSAGDPNWWNLSALSYHYQTQCLPNPIAWYAYRLPLWFHQASTFFMFIIEIGAPFLIFSPRRLRHLGALLLIALQVLIMLTGNFAFFNWLSILLCLAILDDGVTGKFIPAFLLKRTRPPTNTGSPDPVLGPSANRTHTGSDTTLLERATNSAIIPSKPPRRSGAVGIIIVSLMVLLNFNQLAGLVIPRSWWPSPMASFSRWASHFHIVNGYGLFRVMTTKRPEIILEGSDDRTNWKPYEFRYKPGDVSKPLHWVAPHQPRLDWQMWFAALGDYRGNGWVVNLAIRLLEGSPDVLALMGDNPFPDRPPAYVRALLYEYRFATPEERGSTGAVWTRTLNSVYMHPISLEGR